MSVHTYESIQKMQTPAMASQSSKCITSGSRAAPKCTWFLETAWIYQGFVKGWFVQNFKQVRLTITAFKSITLSLTIGGMPSNCWQNCSKQMRQLQAITGKCYGILKLARWWQSKQDSNQEDLQQQSDREPNHLYRLSCYDSSHGNLSRLLSCHWTATGFDRQTGFV